MQRVRLFAQLLTEPILDHLILVFCYCCFILFFYYLYPAAVVALLVAIRWQLHYMF